MAPPAGSSSPSGSSTTSSSSSKRMSYMHLAWSLGHLVVFASTFWVFLGLVFFKSRSTTYYIAYAGALLSWSIVVYKSLGVPSLSKSYIHRAAMDENVQYLAVAVYWFLNKPIYFSLLPFAIFSTFHSLTFIRTTVLKSPPSSGKKDANGAAVPAGDFQTQMGRTIQTWVKANYERAMSMVALVEVVLIMGRITIGAIIFQNTFLHPIFYAHFLRLRYYLSPQTRSAFGIVNAKLDELLGHPSCPPAVGKGVGIARDLIIRYSESILSPAAQVPQPAAGARPQGAAR